MDERIYASLTDDYQVRNIVSTIIEVHMAYLKFSRLNQIQNLWAIIKRRLQKEDCSMMQKMISAVIKVWYHDEELAEMCSNLVECMPKRVK